MIKNKKLLMTLMIKLGFVFDKLGIKVEKNELEWLANDITLELLAFQEIRSIRIVEFLDSIGLDQKVLKLTFGLFVENFREQIDIVSYISDIDKVFENNEIANNLINELNK